MNALNQLLASLKIEANVFHNGQYCGDWAIDTSGSGQMNFHVVTKGECSIEVEGDVIQLCEGDAVFLPCDSEHCLTNSFAGNSAINQTESLPMTDDLGNESIGLVCGNLQHEHPIFEKMVKQMPKIIVVRASEAGAASQVLQLILQESRSSQQHSNLLLNRLADCLFYLLVRNSLDINEGVFAAFAHPSLSSAMELIHKQSDKPLSLDQLASSAAMSRSSFSSTFKEVVGQSPMDYLTQWRMVQAYRWLVDEGITTFEAALRCGYESEASFSKAFKRVMGVGPGSARSKLG